MPIVHDLVLRDGRSLRVHDAATDEGDDRPVLVWHHGSPQTGALLDPLLVACEIRGLRLVSYARPSYLGSTPKPGRTVADAAADVRQLADALAFSGFYTAGASGGGPHALACAALLPRRVSAVVTFAGIGPYTDDGWYDGMVAPDGLRAAAQGRAARAKYAETEEFDENSFIAADYEALSAEWRSLGADAGRAGEAGPDGLIDDDVAFASGWGFAPSAVTAPVLLVHGGLDRVVPPAHSDRLLAELPAAQRWTRPADGHVSVLRACSVALDWLLDL